MSKKQKQTQTITIDDVDDDEWVLMKARNVDHLVLQKTKTHEDGSSWWTGESFTAIDAAIAS